MITELEKGSSNTSMKNSSRQSNTSNLEELGGWRYSQQRCSSKKGIVFRVSKKEREKGRLSRRRLQKAVEIFQKCGVVALEGAISAAKTKKFRDDLNTEMEPILQSRSRVRGILERSMISHGSPINLWEENVSGIQEELFFTQGHVFRERNDGRIDMRLHPVGGFGDPEFLANAFAFPILSRILGERLELKSIHAIQALPLHEGASNEPQHWHRDTGLLFPNDDFFQMRDVHNKTKGVHLPPYAINQFVMLVNATEDNGPTEFSLGSHQWGTKWVDDEEDGTTDARFYLKEGSIVLSDYRTVHRGTINFTRKRRPMGMLIWGRDWWSDSVNYPNTCPRKEPSPSSTSLPSVSKTSHLPSVLQKPAAFALEKVLEGSEEARLKIDRSSASNSIISEKISASVCGEPSAQKRRKNFFKVCVNGWSRTIAQNHRRGATPKGYHRRQ
mmetsp:Transcript_42135/g.70295  ORF Transcript_42135/g.70295 Transcript_42135/m.70295 type:complete len:443 (-) Transcript_42135:56-1384(-)